MVLMQATFDALMIGSVNGCRRGGQRQVGAQVVWEMTQPNALGQTRARHSDVQHWTQQQKICKTSVSNSVSKKPGDPSHHRRGAPWVGVCRGGFQKFAYIRRYIETKEKGFATIFIAANPLITWGG